MDQVNAKPMHYEEEWCLKRTEVKWLKQLVGDEIWPYGIVLCKHARKISMFPLYSCADSFSQGMVVVGGMS